MSSAVSDSMKILLETAGSFKSVAGPSYSDTDSKINDLLLLRGGKDSFFFVHKWSLRGIWEQLVNCVYELFGKHYKAPLYQTALKMHEVYSAVCDECVSESKKVALEKTAGKILNNIKKYLENVEPGITEPFPLAKRFINSCATKHVEGGSERENVLHKIYDGTTYKNSYESSFNDVVEFRKQMSGMTGIDYQGVERIHASRRIAKEISDNFKPSEVFSRVAELDNRESNKVVQFEGDAASFSFPGGYKTHYMTYEIRREKNNYYFIIHNRGNCSDDTSLHGDISLEKDGVEYRRTSVRIEISKGHLSKAFFTELIAAKADSDITAPYDCIKSHLLSKQIAGIQGQVVEHPFEEEYTQLRRAEKGLPSQFSGIHASRIAEVIQRVKDKIIDNGVYHSLQAYGTCTESNRTTPEIGMCDKRTRMKLKLFSTQNLIAGIAATAFKGTQIKNDLLRLGDRRIAHLQSKIASV